MIESGILKKIRKGSVVFTDGAKAYGAIIREYFKGKLLSREVSHKKMEFTRKVRTPKGHSKIAGTESIDSVWGQLTKFIPHSVHSKKSHKINPLLNKYVWAWVARHNRRNVDGFKPMGSLVCKLA